MSVLWWIIICHNIKNNLIIFNISFVLRHEMIKIGVFYGIKTPVSHMNPSKDRSGSSSAPWKKTVGIHKYIVLYLLYSLTVEPSYE